MIRSGPDVTAGSLPDVDSASGSGVADGHASPQVSLCKADGPQLFSERC